MVPTITIDTCVINARNSFPEMTILEEWHKKGFIKIVKADPMDTEMRGYDIGLQKSKDYDEDIGPALYGHSRYGHGFYATEKDRENLDSIKNILFPSKTKEQLSDNEIKDIMHLVSNLKFERDYFITTDVTHIINKRGELEKSHGVKVRAPIEIVNELREMYNFPQDH